MQIRALRAPDDRSSFRSGDPDLDRIEGLPAAERGRLPRYPLPVLRLARLAADRPVQGQGLGGRLLRFVLELAGHMADDHGCAGAVADAKPGAVELCARNGFVPVDATLGACEARPQPKPMFLAMRAIEAASKRAKPAERGNP